MITTDHHDNVVSIQVFGEFTLADYREFEELVNYKIMFEGKVNLLIDLRQMAGFTVDVAVEEIRFSREHPRDFGRVAILSDDQWVTWSAWLTQLFVDAEIEMFADDSEARQWVEGAVAA